MSHFERLAEVPVESKGHLDLVTAADKAVEAFLIEALQQAYPEDGVFGEEGADVTGTSGRTWVIDPIDGTFNFVRGGDQWGISVGLYENGRPKFGVLRFPVRDETYVGGAGYGPTLNGMPLKRPREMDRSRASVAVGFHPLLPVEMRMQTLRFLMEEAGLVMRCCGSCIASLMELARGQTDGYIGSGESSWDVMAALPIVEALGFESTVDWTKSDLGSQFRFAVGRPDFLKLVEPLVPFGTELVLKKG